MRNEHVTKPTMLKMEDFFVQNTIQFLAVSMFYIFVCNEMLYVEKF
jgi:hypothetical protein